ncbi:hypothetical protein [Microbulbifer halophilus]|uniref:MABP domain-containing protein n=1 Tax=Microbulbifer halophilus TaxID=453963 RepID=A0ABW5EF87_9GAMM|nr:hypothetical protein [Microbulbifer halophilus]MCW8127597.1 hypothetical protein [Microbulbifer halophilus]
MSYVTEIKVVGLDTSDWQSAHPGSGWWVVRNAAGAQNFNAGNHGKYIYIYYRWENSSSGLTGLRMIIGEHTPTPEGWQIIPQNLNEGTKGEPIYLCYQRATDVSEITSLKAPRITDLKAGKSNETVTEVKASLSDFHMIGQDTNQGAGGKIVYLGYALGDDAPSYVTEVAVGVIPPYHKPTEGFPTRDDWHVVRDNKGQWFQDFNTGVYTGVTICIYYLLGTTGPGVSGLQMIIGDAPTPEGWQKISKNLNEGTKGTPIYLCYKITHDGPRITDLKGGEGVTAEQAKAGLSGFCIIDQNTNEGAGGKFVYLGYTLSLSKNSATGDKLEAIEFLHGTVPEASIPQGIAIAPDGTAWIADGASEVYLKSTGNDQPEHKFRAGRLLQVPPGQSQVYPYRLAGVPRGRNDPRLRNVALEINDDNALEAVWVSDYGAGYVYRLDPKTTTLDTVDLGEKSKPIGIAWDQWRKLIWVADEAGQLVAVDPETSAEDQELTQSRPNARITQVAVTEAGIWFTEAGTGKVCVLPIYTGNNKDQTAIDEVVEIVLTPDNPKNSSPLGLAVDGDRLWITEYKRGELWIIDDVTDPDLIREDPSLLHRVTSFGSKGHPTDFVVDAVGYFWINLLSDEGKIFALQLTSAGQFVDKYDLGESHHPLGGIAFDANMDRIWISDASPSSRVLVLTPIDRIEPAAEDVITIAASTESGTAAAGELFSEFAVAVIENDRPVERHITLFIESSDKAFFQNSPDEDDQKYIIVKTDPGAGDVAVRTLQARAGAEKGDQFTIKATTRGFIPAQAQPIFTGTIAGISITASRKTGTAAPGELFGEFTVTVAGGGKSLVARDVTLTIEPSNKATFEGNKSSITVKTGADGTAVVKALRAATDTAKDDTFEIKATTRGLKDPVPVYTGVIGERHVVEKAITGITTIKDETEVAVFGADFHRPLQVKLEGPGAPGAKVVFKIIDGSDKAVFKENEQGGSEHTATADKNTAIAGAVLKARNIPGKVVVAAYPATHESMVKKFAERRVVPVPDTMVSTSGEMVIAAGEESELYTIKVTGNYQGHGVPVPNAEVRVRIVKVSPGATGVHFARKGESDVNRLEVLIQTNEQGEASIGDGAEWYVLSPTPGRVNVHFDITQPASSKPVELRLTPTVMRA